MIGYIPNFTVLAPPPVGFCPITERSLHTCVCCHPWTLDYENLQCEEEPNQSKRDALYFGLNQELKEFPLVNTFISCFYRCDRNICLESQRVDCFERHLQLSAEGGAQVTDGHVQPRICRGAMQTI